MSAAPRRRRLSRKGCVSCKRLKIKCNEAKPSCEYCLHRGRVCVYPEEFEVQFKNEVSKDFSKMNTERLRIHLYNSAQVQLNVTRFEYRLLRFFNDHCAELFTYNNSPRAERVWRQSLPSFFGLSPVMRQAVFAFASLNLWPISNLRAILADDEQQSGEAFHTPLEYKLDDLSHVFQRLDLGSESDSSILELTNVFFDNVLKLSAEHVRETSTRGIEYSDIATIYLSTTLTFTYIGLHPHCIMPLVDFELSPPSDLLSYSRSIHNMMRNAPPGVFQAMLEGITEFTFADAKDVHYHVIAALNSELDRHYFPERFQKVPDSIPSLDFPDMDITPELFASDSSSSSPGNQTQTPATVIDEIDSQISLEIETLRTCIVILKTCFHTSIQSNFPIPLYKYVPFLTDHFLAMARSKNQFALRMLLLYSLFCIYGHFYFQKESNLWTQYVNWYVSNYPLCEFDTILYKYVMLEDHIADSAKTDVCFKEVDMLYKDFIHKDLDKNAAGFGSEIDAMDDSLFS